MNDNLPIYGVPDKLKEYSTSKKDIKKGNVRMPPDSFRLKNEDTYEPEIIKTTSSSNEELDLKMIDPEDQIPTHKVHRATYVKKGGDSSSTLQDF